MVGVEVVVGVVVVVEVGVEVVKKHKRNELKTLKNKLWKLCVQLTRKKYGDTCYTCGQTGLKGRNWQTGHLIPKSVCGVYLKYDLRVLRPQCTTCNIWRGGNGEIFLEKMRAIEGTDYINQIFRDRNLITKEKDHYPQLFERYTKMLKETGVSNEPSSN